MDVKAGKRRWPYDTRIIIIIAMISLIFVIFMSEPEVKIFCMKFNSADLEKRFSQTPILGTKAHKKTRNYIKKVCSSV